MARTTMPFTRGDYAPVAERIELFYARHPDGRIVTELVERGEAVVFKALAYRSASDPLPAATGWASERVGDGEINAVACLENTETSAIGRALANLGFTASSRRPSAEEMLKAARERARQINERRAGRSSSARDTGGVRLTPRLVQEPVAEFWPTDPVVIDALEILFEAERAGMSATRVGRLRDRFARGVGSASLKRVDRALRRWLASRLGSRVRASLPERDDDANAVLQIHADAVTDLLALLRAARRCGLRPRRADWIEARVRDEKVSLPVIDRLGRRIRRWMRAAVDQRLIGPSPPTRL